MRKYFTGPRVSGRRRLRRGHPRVKHPPTFSAADTTRRVITAWLLHARVTLHAVLLRQLLSELLHNAVRQFLLHAGLRRLHRYVVLWDLFLRPVLWRVLRPAVRPQLCRLRSRRLLLPSLMTRMISGLIIAERKRMRCYRSPPARVDYIQRCGDRSRRVPLAPGLQEIKPVPAPDAPAADGKN